ncbi:MAG: PAS domain-containing protein [Pseudomonadota bacterium]|nr:PAS domain-containing protein [Pseudomonadota bacterium]
MAKTSSPFYRSYPTFAFGVLALPIIYAALGVTWVVLTDQLLHIIMPNSSAYPILQTVKDSLLVVITGFLIGWVLARLRIRLRNGENRIRSVLNSTSDGMIVLRDGHIVLSNLACCRLLGYERESELLGLDGKRFFDPQAWTEMREHCRGQDFGLASSRRNHIVAKDRQGNRFPVSVGLSKLQMGKNRYQILLISPLDQAHEHASSLQSERDFLMQVLENHPDGLVAQDENREIRFINRAARHLLGLPLNAWPTDHLVNKLEIPAPSDAPLSPVSAADITGYSSEQTPLAAKSFEVRDDEQRTVAQALALSPLDAVTGHSAGDHPASKTLQVLLELQRLSKQVTDVESFLKDACPALHPLLRPRPWIALALVDSKTHQGQMFQPSGTERDPVSCVPLRVIEPPVADAEHARVFDMDQPSPLGHPPAIRHALENAGIDHYLQIPVHASNGVLGLVIVGLRDGRRPSPEVEYVLADFATKATAVYSAPSNGETPTVQRAAP